MAGICGGQFFISGDTSPPKAVALEVVKVPSFWKGGSCIKLWWFSLLIRFEQRLHMLPVLLSGETMFVCSYSSSIIRLYFSNVSSLSLSRYCCKETMLLCPLMSLISLIFMPLWSMWVKRLRLKLCVDAPITPFQSNAFLKYWSTDWVDTAFSPFW